MITESKLNWKKTLNDFLLILNQTVSKVEKQSITEVIDKINENSSEILKEKKCPKCKDGEITIKFAFTGPFVGCTKYKKLVIVSIVMLLMIMKKIRNYLAMEK